MELIINTDGASRGNPGQASWGFVIKQKNGVILHEEGKAIGIATNNIAEYSAVFEALEYLRTKVKKSGEMVILVLADSQLVVNQLTGKFRIKNEFLKIIYDQIKSIESEFKSIKYKAIPRAENFLADKIANLALDRASH